MLGVYEIQDSRFPLSDMQLAALAMVGRTRWRGTINADLANRLGIAYRNFYYIIKVGRMEGGTSGLETCRMTGMVVGRGKDVESPLTD